MYTRAENRDRAAVAIVGGIDDKLIVGSRRKPACDLRAVIALDDVFESVVRQASVADQNAKTARCEIIPGGVREIVDDIGKTGRILLPMPVP